MSLETTFHDLFNQAFDFQVIARDDHGHETSFGQSCGQDDITIVFHDGLSIREFMKKGVSLYLGEAYMNKQIEVFGNHRPLQRLISCGYHLANLIEEHPKLSRVFPQAKQKHHGHTAQENKKEIHAHYDISNDFYRLWLDDTMTYSCAYFTSPTDTLTNAQHHKVHHILQKLNPMPNHTLLDIGCGWGTLMLTACEEYQLNVTGITLSEEQYLYVKQQIKERNLEDRARVLLKDYRELTGETFDYITSVGMFEHVGKDDLGCYFQCIHQLLNAHGTALIHGITRQQGGATDAWLDKYIFPGGYVPGLSEITTHITNQHLQLFDLETLRRHYQKTLECWDDNFKQCLNQVKALGKDETFIRMWDLYLQACAGSFEAGNIDCMQFLINKDASGNTLPMTRDYMTK